MATTKVSTGVVKAFAGTVAPVGWHLCDGSSLSKNDPTFQAVFNVIGTIYVAMLTQNSICRTTVDVSYGVWTQGAG